MKRDWFYVKDLDGLDEVPGTRKYGEGYSIHRSHLPLLSQLHPNAPKPLGDSEERWKARDARTEPLGFTLRRTQQQAIDFISQRRGALLCDEMRLGKTVSAIESHDPKSGNLIVVGPLSSRAVWVGWMRRCFPDTEIGLIDGKNFELETLRKPLVFGHFEVLQHWQSIRPIGTLVVDEAHFLTNPKALRTKAAGVLASCAQKVIALTGTPVWNMPPNLWAILNLVAPEAWGSYHDFAYRYGAPMPTAYGMDYTGISNENELNARMTEIMLRRRWADVGDDLPPITRNVVIADIDLEASQQLDIIASSLCDGGKGNTAATLASYRRAVSTFKINAVVAETKKVQSRNEPVVVWTWHRDVAESLGRRLPNSWVITGEQNVRERERRIAEWKLDTNGVLIATMAVAQVAVDFSHARLAIFAELDYTPGVLAQAEMRTFSPARSMNITFVVLNHVVDQRLVIALERKLSAATPINVGAATDAIESLRLAVLGGKDEGDMVRFLDDLLAD